MVYWGWLGSNPVTICLKYLGQTLQTRRILKAERPSSVFVMSPPVFAALAALSYCRRHGASLVIDAHTGAFLNPRWRHLQWLQFWVCRQALTTIVTNSHLQTLVEEHRGHATVVPDVPVTFPASDSEPYELTSKVNVVMVCSFGIDEPIEAMIEAAKGLPDVNFHVTGNPAHLDPRLAKALPSNVRLTGFLATPSYGSLVKQADVVMTLTTKDHTMLRGAWEAVYLGTPVIVSDWPVLRQSFDQGAIHVENTTNGIRNGLVRMLDNLDSHRLGVVALRERKARRWKSTKQDLIDLLTAAR